MIVSLRGNQRSLHTRQNLFCLRQRQPQIGDLGKAGGSIDLYQVDTICRDVGACFDQSQNPTHARSPGQKDKDRRIAPGPIPPISGQSPRRTDIDINNLMVMMLDALAQPYEGLTFQLKDKDWYLTDDACAANPVCSHADNAKGVNIKLQISTRERPILPVAAVPQLDQDYFGLL